MAEHNTFADYAAKNGKWRSTLNIPAYVQYSEQVDIARQVIDDLGMEDPDKYEQFLVFSRCRRHRRGRSGSCRATVASRAYPAGTGRHRARHLSDAARPLWQRHQLNHRTGQAGEYR